MKVAIYDQLPKPLARLGRHLLRLVSPGRRNNGLSQCRGVIHVGANSGQERKVYARLGLDVLWIEPIPGVFAELCESRSNNPSLKRPICLAAPE